MPSRAGDVLKGRDLGLAPKEWGSATVPASFPSVICRVFRAVLVEAECLGDMRLSCEPARTKRGISAMGLHRGVEFAPAGGEGYALCKNLGDWRLSGKSISSATRSAQGVLELQFRHFMGAGP